MKIPNIQLGFSKSRYSHNLSRDTNTTFPFGVVQPIFSQYMLPNSDIKVDAKQLVRLAPLPVPSFARVSLRTVTRFIPEIDVVPYADAFYSKMPYRGKVPSSLPTISNVVLLNYLFSISNFSIYSLTSNGNNKYSYELINTPSSSIITQLSQALGKLIQNVQGSSSPYVFPLSAKNVVDDTNKTALVPVSAPESCDYLVFLSTTSSTTPNYCICFQYGALAKNFRNICVGLGYSLDLDDYSPLRFSPLLSFYRAYYDTYGITRFKAFTETPCFFLITQYIDTLSNIDFTKAFTNTTVYNHLVEFFNSLARCYYASDQDFVSLHRDSVENYSLNLNYGILDGNNESVSASSKSVPHIDTSNSPYLTNIGLRTLSRLSHFISKNSVLGKRLSEYMRLHYGTEVVASVFKDSNFVSSSVLDCNINDVFSTSDTALYDAATDTKTGENLGAYAGKGLGYGDLSFKYSAPCHGYLITLASIVPDSGYFQGNNTDLFAVTWEQQPSSDFDALGYEVTPRSAFISHNSISNRSKLAVSDITDSSFGFVPRFSGFKFAKNIVNGDMSRRGSIDSLSPYYLDHIISSQQVDDISTGSSKQILYTGVSVPSSSYDWRYVCKYPWLGNFLRIFINDVGPLSKGSSSVPSWSYERDYDRFCLDDPFICQCAFKVHVSNCLKPLSLSYDTYEDETDNASKDVNPS